MTRVGVRVRVMDTNRHAIIIGSGRVTVRKLEFPVVLPVGD